ncbi:vacuolar protein sorting-associated protein 53 [[Candida] anglica]|uniref:Vacuolar protein sorting-associated protein 53 n=1 Tax=[Candida] anglica TaxID=148631 RepID=A0ABP0EHV7_9ASCO
MSSSFQSRDYSPAAHLNALFQSPEALNELPDLLQHIHTYKSQLDSSINQSIEEYNHTIRQSSFDPKKFQQDVSSLLVTIKTTKSKASKTEQTITSMSQTIQSLDQSKKNLVHSMTVLKRLQMLISANDTLTQTIPSKNYKEILSLFSVVKELSSHFKPYKSIDEIASLNAIINRSQAKLVDDIFLDYEDAIQSDDSSRVDLQYAAQILEIISSSQKLKLIDWFCNIQLREIQGIFKSSDEAGSLENVARRYIFFKKVLSVVSNDLTHWFPEEWHIDLEVSKKFCTFTKNDLQKVLNHYNVTRKSSSSGTNPDVLLNALTATLEFEKFLNQTLNTEVFDQFISRSFEPYLSVWVSQQDSMMESKFMEYLSTPKIPEELNSNTYEGLLSILSTNAPPNIASSSAELFRTYRNILAQTTKLSSGPILGELSDLSVKFLIQYAQRVLLPCLPTNIEVLTGVESLKYLTMVLNTSDYCSNTSSQLEDKIKSTIDEDLKEIINFDDARESFIELITNSITLLLTKISKDLDFCWRQFQNINWSNMDNVGDVSRYMTDTKRILNENMRIILPLIVREGYVRNFCNKVVELVVNQFMNQWKCIKPINTVNAEQLLLDLSALKSILLALPMYEDPTFEESIHPHGASTSPSDLKVSASYGKFVNSQIHKAETVLKVLLSPTKPIDDFVSNYLTLIGDKSSHNFGKLLNLKGVHGQESSPYVDNFLLQIASGEDLQLVDSSPLLSQLKTEGEEAADKIKKPIPTISKPVTGSTSNTASNNIFSKSPRLNGNFSPPGAFQTPFQNNLNINNIEKSFRELALNGENKVSKINENFKNFGKLFRKDNNE